MVRMVRMVRSLADRTFQLWRRRRGGVGVVTLPGHAGVPHASGTARCDARAERGQRLLRRSLALITF